MILYNGSGRAKFLGIIAATLVQIQGCGEDWAQNLNIGGSMIPNGRLHVTLAEPMPSHELFGRLDDVVTRAGFPDRRSGEPIVSDQPPVDGAYRAWVWHPSERSNTSNFYRDYLVDISWNETLEDPIGFDFILHNKSADDFTALEWLLFYRWVDYYIPTTFPGSTIVITRHPAEFNSCDDMARISKLTGISVPEKTASLCAEEGEDSS